MPLDLNSMRCQSQQVAGYFGVVVRFLGVICFICGVNTDDAKEFQNNREYVLYVHKNNLVRKECGEKNAIVRYVVVQNWM
jgi:hypothetical protein